MQTRVFGLGASGEEEGEMMTMMRVFLASIRE